MLNIFLLSPNDQSINYLGLIFGNVGIALQGTGPALFKTMFTAFNSMLLTVGTLIVAYITIVGVMLTAQEGEFLGKKWHKLWMPIRTVMGLVALFPTGGGYCAIQVVVMWIVVQGIGAADVVWNKTLDYFQSGGQSISGGPPSFNDPTNTLPDTMKKIMGGVTCHALADKFMAKDPTASTPISYDPSQDMQYNFGDYTPGDGGPTIHCGGVTMSGVTVNGAQDPGSLDAQKQAMATIIPTLQAVANYYASSVINDSTCWTNIYQSGSRGWGANRPLLPCVSAATYTANANNPNFPPPFPPQCPYFDRYTGLQTSGTCSWMGGNVSQSWNALLTRAGSNFMSDAVTLFYGYATNYAVSEAVASGTLSTSTAPTNITAINQSRANGWIFAGGLYFAITSHAAIPQGSYTDFIKGIQVVPIHTGGDSSSAVTNPSSEEVIQQKINDKIGPLLDAADQAAIAAQQAGGGVNLGTSNGSSLPGSAKGASGVSGAATGVINMWVKYIIPKQGEDPLVRLHEFGHNCLIAADAIFWIFFAIGLVLGFASTAISVFGNTVNYFAGIATFLQLFLIPVVFAIVAYLITIGGTFGVYLPLLPYVIFSFGVLGWFLAVIEIMIAAPIMALGMLAPSGQHEILGKAEASLNALQNIFLRPTLMIFGLMGAMLLGSVVVQFVNAAFLSVLGYITQGGYVGMFECFLYIAAYASLIFTILSKVYGLIYQVPEKVLTYIGGQAVSYGEAEMAGKMEQKVTGAGGAIAGAGKGAGGGSYGGAAGVGKLGKGMRAEQQEIDQKNQQTDEIGGAQAQQDQEEPPPPPPDDEG